MMQEPVLDPRSRSDLMEELAAHARAYTPEWRYEGAEDDPGSALAELFGEMFYQTVDRMNSVPGKLHTEFLNLTGFQMPDPVPAAGLLQFTAHDTVDAPVPVPQGTQVFTEDEDGENIVYETARGIESTPAQLQDLFYVDPREEMIQRRAPDQPQPFFRPTGGENLQRHSFTLSQNDVLALSGPCVVEVELQQESAFTSAETAARLADPAVGHWTFPAEGGERPFSTVEAEGNRVILTWEGEEGFAPLEDGNYAVRFTGNPGHGRTVLDGVRLRSRPMGTLPLDSVSFGDVPLDLEEGGYCFGRRPADYGLCYFRSDRVFRKRGARALLRLDIVPVVNDLSDQTPHYQFNQRIIDKRDAVAIVPDDVYIAQVAWEYFNGTGWRTLKVSGSRNPFSCKQDVSLEVTFDVPGDLEETEVNAQSGYYIRARVVHVENAYSTTPRWLVPLLKGAVCSWSYAEGLPVERCRAENNGGVVELEEVSQVGHLAFPALEGLEEHPRAMYFRFDRSPHAMPLSIFFDVAGRAKLEDKLHIQAWTGQRFETVRMVDLTRNLLHPGVMLLYLPRPLPPHTLFGQTGYWLRLSRSSYLEQRGGSTLINGIKLNIVQAVQRERAAAETFSAGAYEADKVLELLERPVLDTRVWVDEVSALAVADAEELSQAMPGRVRLEREDRVLTHCWVRWERVRELALAGPAERCYQLDPYAGIIVFGDGIHGRVPPEGRENIRVDYAYGGGSRGNRPAGTVNRLIGALPRISQVENLTAMSGGTDRFPVEKAEAIGNKRLRHRGRAIGVRDFEEIVSQEFPQVRHVKCFPGRDMEGAYAPGHVSVVVEGRDLDDSRVTDDLCQHIYEELSQRCDCVMTEEGRLHVVGSTVITVSSTVTVEMEDLDQSAVTQQEIARRLEELVNVRWREREIGSQLQIAQVWQTVRDTPNVRLVRSILLEGRYDQAGLPRVVPLEDDGAFPYATVKSGEHFIQVI